MPFYLRIDCPTREDWSSTNLEHITELMIEDAARFIDYDESGRATTTVFVTE